MKPIVRCDEKWLVLTAGLGDYSNAAKRLAHKASSFSRISKVVILDESNLSEYCPQVFSSMKALLNSQVKGFGYYAWKIEFIYNALRGQFGDYSGIMWIDAGCEMMNTRWSRKRLDSYIRITNEKGIFAFTLFTEERKFTKSETFKLFEVDEATNSKYQFQATVVFASGPKALQIFGNLVEIVLQAPEILDLNVKGENSHPLYVEHRSDQSLISLAIKSSIPNVPLYSPIDGRSQISQLRGLSYPIWTARNRTGLTIKTFFTRRLEVLLT
jgi:hypothetical protein